MKRAVIISSHPKMREWLKDCLNSLEGCSYPIVITYNSDFDNQYDIKAIHEGIRLDFDEFITLHDTTLVKDIKLLDILFNTPGMISISPRFLMLIGKFTKEGLKGVSIPITRTKKEAVDVETSLHNKINFSVLDQNFIDGNHRFEYKHGRENMVLENEYLIKYKGTWTMEQVTKADGG